MSLSSTLVLPFPVELLRFLERSTPTHASRPAGEATTGSVDDKPEGRPTVAELLGAASRSRNPAAVNGTTAHRPG
jgi:hypothetical protein